MKFEIINPSDECYISSEDIKVAQFCCFFAGDGKYGLTRVDAGETALPILCFGGGVDEFMRTTFGDVKEYCKNNLDAILECLDSFEYARERTSVNNIESQFKWLKKALAKEYAGESKKE